MKKLLTCSLCLLLLLSLAACGSAAESPAPDESTPSTAPASSAAPEESSSAPSPQPEEDGEAISQLLTQLQTLSVYDTFPTPDGLDEEQQERFLCAMIAATQFEVGGTFGSTSPTETVHGGDYVKSNGLFTTYEEVTDAMLLIFTQEEFDRLNRTGENFPHFFEEDGVLYCSDGARGTNIFYNGIVGYEMVEETDDTIRFTLLASYDDEGEVTEESHPFTLVNTQDSWRFSQVSLPY